MFEDSLFESQPHAIAPRSRWTTAAAVGVQVMAASLLLILPLLHTELLPGRLNETKLVAPVPSPPPIPKTVAQRTSSAIASMAPMLGRLLVAPRITPSRIDTSQAPDTSDATLIGMGPAAIPGAILGVGRDEGSRISVTPVQPKKIGPVRVSAGVSAGLLLAPIRPVYPPIAKAAHVEGTVVVEAMISKAGTIESLHVLSGPAMLQSAAIEAIRAARYQPFQLNGEPTEVQTTITVNFRIGG